MRSLFLFFIVVLPTLLSAQDSRVVQCRFLSFGGIENPPSAIASSEKDAEVTCPLSSSQISPPIGCVAKANTIAFLSSADRKPLATATIPQGVNAALLVFIQAPQAPDGPPPAWRILVIEDSAKNFPAGGTYVANFYNKDIRFVIGEHKGMLRAGGSHGYTKPTELDSFNMAPVVFEFQNNNQWHIANESALRFLSSMRYLIFAYVDPVSGRPRINTYQDFASTTPEKKSR